MSITLNPYLTFSGNCRDVMEFYKSVFGGELTMQTFGEAGAPTDDASKDQIMHADLQGDMIRLMASDGGSQMPIKVGNNVSISLSGEDEEALTKYFNALSAGGNVEQP